MKKIIILSILVLVKTSYAQNNNAQLTKSQFIYVLKLTPKYYDDKNWSSEDMKVVQEHFARLQQMLKEVVLYVAGRADVENSKTFGIVVFDAENLEKAKMIAEADPAVKSGIMTVEVFPFNVALMK